MGVTGDWLIVPPSEPRRLEVMEDSAILLTTITLNDDCERAARQSESWIDPHSTPWLADTNGIFTTMGISSKRTRATRREHTLNKLDAAACPVRAVAATRLCSGPSAPRRRQRTDRVGPAPSTWLRAQATTVESGRVQVGRVELSGHLL